MKIEGVRFEKQKFVFFTNCMELVSAISSVTLLISLLTLFLLVANFACSANCLDPDQTHHIVAPDLDSDCFTL